MTPVKVFNLILDPESQQYIVALEETKGPRLLLIWIGAPEARAIALGIQGIRFERPLTHDLLISILQSFDIKILDVIISDIKDGTYYAYINMIQGTKRIKMDSRPSDAIAIAINLSVPIFVEENVWKAGSVIFKPITEEEEEEFRKQLEHLRPEDFMDL